MGRQGIALGRNIEYHPVPPTAAGRGVWVIDGQRIALGALGSPVPVQGRGNIVTTATKVVEHLLVGQVALGLDIRAAEGERGGRLGGLAAACQQAAQQQGEWVSGGAVCRHSDAPDLP